MIELVLALIALVYVAIVFKQDMQMMQQNTYRNERYIGWLKSSSDFMSINRLIDVALLMLMLSSFFAFEWAAIMIGVVLIIQIVVAVKKKYKKPVVFTKRVWRLYISNIVATLLLLGSVYLFSQNIVATIAIEMCIIIFSYIVTMAINYLLKPVEAHINNSYYKEAQRLLAQMPDMKIVGITGSYGKTSTKHYLNRILNEKYDVLMTPGSFNTPMGVIRTVREMLKPYNNLFIVEMGAKNIGDIKELCDLVHPTIGIITAVGEQHLESFKSIENVQRTKFELVDALPRDGFAVVNNDFPYVANREVTNVAVKRYAVTAIDGVDYVAENIQYSASGTQFTVVGNGQSIELNTKLVGECNISNLMAAVIVAMYLDVPAEKIKYAVSKIEQVEHRLNLKRTPSGITIIDDAYNSNPDGSKMALDVLSRMNTGKRIVITPGMIELGDKQAHYNEIFGEHIAKTCDIAIVVGRYNREAILAGIAKGKMSQESIYVADTFKEAQAHMLAIATRGDTVLYENDLPDTFK
ncbi:MAG: UDP-N-acetylmuramoyl-tripeptide--D-alanyl-D-alanine ligase [Muribaculaceae bacterium]